MICIIAERNNRGVNGAARQATALRREGVTVETGHLGELTVNLVTFGWFPDGLPSEEVEAVGPSESAVAN